MVQMAYEHNTDHKPASNNFSWKKNNRIVFWYDVEREFEESLPMLKSCEFYLILISESLPARERGLKP